MAYLSESSIFFGDGDATLGDARRAERLFDQTFRPLGPTITLTALLKISTPLSVRSHASCENFTLFAVMSSHALEDMRG